MKLGDVTVGMVVRLKDGQRAVVVEVKPDAKYYVRVQLDGALSPISWPVTDMKRAALSDAEKIQRDVDAGFMLYPTADAERAVRKWTFTKWTSELAWVVGFAAEVNAAMIHSGQPNGGRSVEDEFEPGANSHGEKFDVVMANPNYLGLDDILDINFVQTRVSLRSVSLNKEGFWRFLESLGFENGRDAEQKVSVIRKSVPEEYRADFDMGVRGSVPTEVNAGSYR